MRIIMPEELGGKEYRFFSALTNKTMRIINKYKPKVDPKLSEEEQMEQAEELMTDDDKLSMAQDIIIAMSVEPKLKVSDLDDMGHLETMFIYREIMNSNITSKERMTELQKKVIKR